MDSGFAVSLVRKDTISPRWKFLFLVIGTEDDLLVVDHVQTTVQILHHTITYSFIVVNTLITSAILGTADFLQQHSGCKAYERRLAYSVAVRIRHKNTFKSFITKVLEYKVCLNRRIMFLLQ